LWDLLYKRGVIDLVDLGELVWFGSNLNVHGCSTSQNKLSILFDNLREIKGDRDERLWAGRGKKRRLGGEMFTQLLTSDSIRKLSPFFFRAGFHHFH
jgi:hypothetical protein